MSDYGRETLFHVDFNSQFLLLVYNCHAREGGVKSSESTVPYKTPQSDLPALHQGLNTWFICPLKSR